MPETSGEFISIGKGAIASEAINQQLADTPQFELGLVQTTAGVYDFSIGIERKVGLAEVDFDKFESFEPPFSSIKSLIDGDEVNVHPRLKNVKFAIEATPYSAHEEMAELIPGLAEHGIFTVMASKGFMAEHPEKALELYQSGYLGIDATLGGNTGIFPLFEGVSDERTVAFEGIVNGTKSRILDLMRGGRSAEEILPIVLPKTPDNPKGEGLAEPNATTLLEVFQGEHGDNVGKAVNAYNFGVLPNDSGDIDASEIARASEVEISEITQEQVDQLFESPHNMAYVVNWHRDGGEIPPEYYDESRVPGVFTLRVGASGLIVGGFRRLPETSPIHVITQRKGPLNGMAITKKIKNGLEGRDNHVIIGTGAGPVPTAHRMVLNTKRLLEQYD